MFIKVCGLTTEEQIDWAIDLGYTAIGIVGTPRSKRYCAPDRSRALARYCRNRIESFVVAYNQVEIEEAAAEFDVIQLYEWTDLPNLAISSSEKPPADARFQYYFYDASIGTGVYSTIPEWVREVKGNVVLAGGLNAHNVADVIKHYVPFGVDVSSSVEISPGIKSHELMKQFRLAVNN